MEDLKSMKKTRFISMLLASQLVLCGFSNNTLKVEAASLVDNVKGAVCQEIEGIVGSAFWKGAKYVLGATVMAVVTEEGIALCREKFCKCAFSYQALSSAGLDIEGARNYYNENRERHGNGEDVDLRSWCLDNGFAQVKMGQTDVPGLYCYDGLYYFLTGYQGIQLGKVLDDAISFANTFWETLKETTITGVTYAFQQAKAFMKLADDE